MQTHRRGWVPIIMAMLISSAGGVVLQRFVDKFSTLSLFDPVVNGVGGNIAAVHAARLSTDLHVSYVKPFSLSLSLSRVHGDDL